MHRSLILSLLLLSKKILLRIKIKDDCFSAGELHLFRKNSTFLYPFEILILRESLNTYDTVDKSVALKVGAYVAIFFVYIAIFAVVMFMDEGKYVVIADGAYRIPLNETQLPTIPVQPITFNEAKILMRYFIVSNFYLLNFLTYLFPIKSLCKKISKKNLKLIMRFAEYKKMCVILEFSFLVVCRNLAGAQIPSFQGKMNIVYSTGPGYINKNGW